MKDMTERQLIEDLLSALEYHTEQTRPIQFSRVAIEVAREYLRKPAQQSAERGEPVKLSGYELDGRRYKTMEERLKDAFYEGFTSSATYNDIELNDVDEEWLKYATAHGITKGNT